MLMVIPWYNLNLNVGRRSSKSFIAAESVNGSAKIQIANSLSECQDLKTRKILSRSFGFNQKSIDFLKSNFYTCVKDYLNIYDVLKVDIPIYGERVPYFRIFP